MHVGGLEWSDVGACLSVRLSVCRSSFCLASCLRDITGGSVVWALQCLALRPDLNDEWLQCLCLYHVGYRACV